jgi:phage N-6-adenine-methyltransferase
MITASSTAANAECSPGLAIREGESLPALIDRASARLAAARSAGEVLEARDAARAALALAKVMQAANETQADCLRIIARAEIRMADEIDKGQVRGEVAKAGNPQLSGLRTIGMDDLGVSRQRLAEWRELRDAGETAVESAIQSALDEGRQPTKADIHNHVRGTLGTGENEWFTPREWIDLARHVLDAIDVDPASNPLAQQTVKAATFYSKDDDGLSKDWHGRVWLNPPYAQPYIAQFADKMLAELAAGHVTQSIMLTHNYTDTSWFQKLAARADAICFTRGRIRFESPAGDLAAPTQGQAFFYFGDDPERFSKVFAEAGFIR